MGIHRPQHAADRSFNRDPRLHRVGRPRLDETEEVRVGGELFSGALGNGRGAPSKKTAGEAARDDKSQPPENRLPAHSSLH